MKTFLQARIAYGSEHDPLGIQIEHIDIERVTAIESTVGEDMRIHLDDGRTKTSKGRSITLAHQPDDQ